MRHNSEINLARSTFHFPHWHISPPAPAIYGDTSKKRYSDLLRYICSATSVSFPPLPRNFYVTSIASTLVFVSLHTFFLLTFMTCLPNIVRLSLTGNFRSLHKYVACVLAYRHWELAPKDSFFFFILNRIRAFWSVTDLLSELKLLKPLNSIHCASQLRWCFVVGMQHPVFFKHNTMCNFCLICPQNTVVVLCGTSRWSFAHLRSAVMFFLEHNRFLCDILPWTLLLFSVFTVVDSPMQRLSREDCRYWRLQDSLPFMWGFIVQLLIFVGHHLLGRMLSWLLGVFRNVQSLFNIIVVFIAMDIINELCNKFIESQLKYIIMQNTSQKPFILKSR